MTKAFSRVLSLRILFHVSIDTLDNNARHKPIEVCRDIVFRSSGADSGTSMRQRLSLTANTAFTHDGITRLPVCLNPKKMPAEHILQASVFNGRSFPQCQRYANDLKLSEHIQLVRKPFSSVFSLFQLGVHFCTIVGRFLQLGNTSGFVSAWN